MPHPRPFPAQWEPLVQQLVQGMGWGTGSRILAIAQSACFKGGGGWGESALGNRSCGHSLAEQCWVCLTGGSHQAKTSLPAFRHKSTLGSIREGFL